MYARRLHRFDWLSAAQSLPHRHVFTPEGMPAETLIVQTQAPDDRPEVFAKQVPVIGRGHPFITVENEVVFLVRPG
jgi:hypothetical protein